jgi:hypothetical protein
MEERKFTDIADAVGRPGMEKRNGSVGDPEGDRVGFIPIHARFV